MASSETIDKSAPAALHQVVNTWSPYSAVSQATRIRLRQLWERLGFNHETASKLRYEVDMVLLRTRCALGLAHRRQIRDLASRHDLLVHLGCGNALLPGWINMDCYPPQPAEGIEILTLDMRRGLPLPSGSVAAIFSEHFLEHLPMETVRGKILPEVRRVLEPGGTVRIGVPNGEYFVEQYVAYRAGERNTLFEKHRGGKTPMTMLNEIAHGFGHYFAYDFETMASLLSDAGLTKISRRSPFDSDVEHFKGKDRVDEWRNAMTLYVEAEAPRRAE